jgi:Na+/H+ antiporter NhaD/arsenite permease-like protein
MCLTATIRLRAYITHLLCLSTHIIRLADYVDGNAAEMQPGFFNKVLRVPDEAANVSISIHACPMQGWIDAFASGIGSQSQSLAAGVFLMGWLAVFLCNVINNQPLTILLTRVCLNSNYTSRVPSPLVQQASLFALVIASNVGAMFTIIGALAGIMWANIIRSKGVVMTYTMFSKLALLSGFVGAAVSLFALWFEYAVYGHDW